jgi:hypothetical protein
MDVGCPCKEGRFGAAGLVISLYWLMQCGGVPSMLHLVAAGTGMGIWWAIWTGCAVIELGQGIIQARSHDDDFDGRSVLVSVGLLGLAFWALAHRWFLIGDEWIARASFIVWPSLIASEVFNLWLNFRGRRHAAAPVAAPVVEQRRSPRFYRRRFARRYESKDARVSEWLEETCGDAPDNHIAPPRASHVIEHDGEAAQLVYVKDSAGRFVPVQLPPGRVPVNRRLR